MTALYEFPDWHGDADYYLTVENYWAMWWYCMAKAIAEEREKMRSVQL